MSTFANVLLNHYQDTPSKTSITFLTGEIIPKPISYHDLILGSAGYAHALDQLGIQPGEVVILILKHSEELLYAFWGTILQGAVPSIMPFLTEKLSPSQYRASLSALFQITQPAAIVTLPEYMADVEYAKGDQTSIRAIFTPGMIQQQDNLKHLQFKGLRCAPKDIVLLQHSSGTTGLQKGVALSHKAIFNQLENYSPALQLSQDDVIVSWLPLYHDMGLIAGLVMPVLCGVHLVLMSPFDWVRAPYKLMSAVSEYRGTLTWLPNFAYNFCAQKIRDQDLGGVDLSSWRGVINCSEPTIWSSHKMFLDRFQPYGLKSEALVTSYAMAENVFAVTQSGLMDELTIDNIDKNIFHSRQVATPVEDDVDSLQLLSAGKPIANTQVKIIDELGEDLPERHIGEIAIKSNCMLDSYYQRPNLTKTAFQQGWYLTGDMGYLSGSELFVTGRKKDIIIVGGKNIYPQDLERLAFEVDGVHPGRAVAFGVLNMHTGTEDVILIAEVDTPDQARRQAIGDSIRQRITQGSDVALRYVYPVDRGWLLKTSSGKIARTANRDKYLSSFKP